MREIVGDDDVLVLARSSMPACRSTAHSAYGSAIAPTGWIGSDTMRSTSEFTHTQSFVRYVIKTSSAYQPRATPVTRSRSVSPLRETSSHGSSVIGSAPARNRAYSSTASFAAKPRGVRYPSSRSAVSSSNSA